MITEIPQPPQPTQPLSLKIDELLKRPSPPTDLYEETRNWTYRGNADKFVAATLGFGGDWLPQEVVLLADKIDRDIRTKDTEKHIGAVIVPTELGESLPSVSALLSATDTTASVSFSATIGDKQAAQTAVTLNGNGIAVPVIRKAGGKAEETRTALAGAKEKANQFYERWQDLISKAVNGDNEAITYLTAGMWAHIYTADHKVPQINGWKELLLQDTHDSQLMDIIRLEGSSFGLYDVDRIVGHCNFNSPQKFVDSLRATVKEIIDTPDNDIKKDTIPRTRRLLLTALDRSLKQSSVGRALSRDTAVIAGQAADDCDFGALIQTYLEADPQIDTTIAEGLVRITSRRGLPGSIASFQKLLDQASRYAGYDVRCELGQQVDLHTGENLKPYDELLGKAQQLKLDSVVRARLRKNLADGKVITWLWGVTGTAKTTTAAILARGLREKEQALGIVAPIEQTPEGVTAAIRQAIADLALSKPTLLVIDDVHLSVKDMTPAQVHDLQKALDTANNILGKVNVTGGIILTGEHPPETHALGMPHRAVAIEMSLWKGDLVRDNKLLAELCGTRAIDISKPEMKAILDTIGGRIQQAGTARKYLSGSFLLDQIQLATTRIDSGEAMTDITRDLEEAMQAQMLTATEERTESAAEALGSRMGAVEERLNTIETGLKPVVEIAEKQDAIAAQLNSLQEMLSSLQALVQQQGATTNDLQQIVASLQARIEELTKGRTQPTEPGKLPVSQAAKNLFG